MKTIIFALIAILSIHTANAGSCRQICARYQHGVCVQMRVIHTDRVHHSGGWYPCAGARVQMSVRTPPYMYEARPPAYHDPYVGHDPYAPYEYGQDPISYGQSARMDESQALHDVRIQWEAEQRMDVESARSALTSEQVRGQALQTQLQSTQAQRDAAFKAAMLARTRAQHERERAQSAEDALRAEEE